MFSIIVAVLFAIKKAKLLTVFVFNMFMRNHAGWEDPKLFSQ